MKFLKNYINKFRTGNMFVRFMLIAFPLSNIFILNGIFSMFLVLLLDFCLVKYVMR